MRAGMSYRKRRRLNVRFFIILTVLIVLITGTIMFFALPRQTHIVQGTIAEGDILDCIVIFNEARIELPDNERIIFDVPNNSVVKAEEKIGDYYKKGYIESAFDAYFHLQQTIVTYQNDVLLKDIYQNELNQYAIDIETILTELQTFDPETNDYINVNKKIYDLLAGRQEYIRQNYPADEYLQTLYDEESDRINALNDWIQPIKAVGNGYVSWYVNSDYNNINTNTAAGLSVSDIRKTLLNRNIYKNVNNSNEFSVRIISDGYVYLAAIMTGEIALGQSIILYTDSHKAELSGSVIAVNGSGSEKAVIVRVDCAVSDMLEHRIIKAATSPLTSGLIVPADYIKNDGGVKYVFAQVNGKKVAVSVNVVFESGGQAVVEAVENGKLTQDQKIFSK